MLLFNFFLPNRVKFCLYTGVQFCRPSTVSFNVILIMDYRSILIYLRQSLHVRVSKYSGLQHASQFCSDSKNAESPGVRNVACKRSTRSEDFPRTQFFGGRCTVLLYDLWCKCGSGNKINHQSTRPQHCQAKMDHGAQLSTAAPSRAPWRRPLAHVYSFI
jgi:hypothetical protein